jgi:hypothetical protein
MAHILIEVNLMKELPKSLWTDNLKSCFYQIISYDNPPKYCMQCPKIGHYSSSCYKNQENRKIVDIRDNWWKRISWMRQWYGSKASFNLFRSLVVVNIEAMRGWVGLARASQSISFRVVEESSLYNFEVLKCFF